MGKGRRVSGVVWGLAVCVAIQATCLAGGAVILNPGPSVARSVCLMFSEPVEVEVLDGAFRYAVHEGAAERIILSGGQAAPFEHVSVRWAPADATLLREEWAPHGGGVQLDIAIPREAASFDPLHCDFGDRSNAQVVTQLFVGLVGVDGETGRLKPALATSWEVSDDGLEWAFHLRDDAAWSDGVSITAHDAAFALLRALEMLSGVSQVWMLHGIENAQAYNEGLSADADAVEIRVADEHTLRIRLREPAMQFPWHLTFAQFFPVPRHAVEAHGDEWSRLDRIVTSGPYRTIESSADGTLLLRKSETFYDADRVDIELVRIHVADVQTAWELYLAGILDTTTVPVGALGDVPPDDRVELALRDSGGTYTDTFLLVLNENVPPFNDPLVRKALVAAIDRRALAEWVSATRGETAVPAWCLNPPQLLRGADEDVEGLALPFDVQQARRWLEEAGFPGGVGLPPLKLYGQEYSANDGVSRAWDVDVVVPFLEGAWERYLGVDVLIETISGAERREMGFAEPSDIPATWFNWREDYPEGINALHVADASTGVFVQLGRRRNEELHAALVEMTQTPLQSDRLPMYWAFEAAVADEAVVIPLFHLAEYHVSKPYLERTYLDWMAHDTSAWRLVIDSSG